MMDKEFLSVKTNDNIPFRCKYLSAVSPRPPLHKRITLSIDNCLPDSHVAFSIEYLILVFKHAFNFILPRVSEIVQWKSQACTGEITEYAFLVVCYGI